MGSLTRDALICLMLLHQGAHLGLARMLRASPSMTDPIQPVSLNDTQGGVQSSQGSEATIDWCAQEPQGHSILGAIDSESLFEMNERCFDLLDLPFDTDLGKRVETADGSRHFSFDLDVQQDVDNINIVKRDK